MKSEGLTQRFVGTDSGQEGNNRKDGNDKYAVGEN